MPYTKYKTASFGPGKTGLAATVGYTVNGVRHSNSSIPSAGIVEVAAGSGIYGATITFPASYVGPLTWDTGESPTPVFTNEDINPGLDELTDSAISTRSTFDNVTDNVIVGSVDPVVIETGINMRQALSLTLAESAAKLSISGNSVVMAAAGNPNVTRITATTDSNGQRTVVSLNPPA